MDKEMYTILFSRKADKTIKNLPINYRANLKEKFERLIENPFIFPYKKIKGEENLYRIRIGPYRILYEVNFKEKVIYILKVDHRSSVYK